MSSLSKLISGFAWTVALRGGTRLLTYVKISVIARLLSPAEFGLFGIASLALAILDVLTETGLNIFLIQYKKDVSEVIDSVWLLSLIRGLFLSVVLLLFAPLIAVFFNEPASLPILQLIAVVPFIKGAVNPSIVLLQKNLFFGKDFFIRLAVLGVDVVVTIAAVMATDTVQGLVIGMIVSSTFEVLLSFLLFKQRPVIILRFSQLKAIFSSGKWVNAAAILNYAFHNIDDVAVGKLIGTAALGSYQMAYKWGTLPITEVGETYTKVALPTMVRLREDEAALKKFYFTSLFYLTVIICVFVTGLYLFTEQLINFVLGPQWLEITEILRILLLFGAVRAVSGTSATLFYAVNKQKYVALVTLVSTVVMVMALFPLLDAFGVVGAAWASCIGAVAAIPVMAYGVWKVLYNSSDAES